MKRIPFFTSALASFVLALATTHGLADDAVVNSADKSFLQNAYQDGEAEIHAGGLAENKTANPDVKAFATQMIKDHGDANSQLKVLADSKRVSVSTNPGLVAQGKDVLLDTKSGDSFDKSFVDGMVSDHKKAVEAFEKAANEAKDPDVKAFAEKTLPTLRHHLEMAEQLQAKLGK